MQHQNLCAIHRFEERDIDLLMAEELRINRAFAAWVMGRVAPEQALAFPATETRVSVVEDGSEADVIASFSTPAGATHRLFIENKITASLMPDQLERYVARAEAEKRRGAVVDWSVMFFTPAAYQRTSLPEGVVQVTFEEAADALRGHSQDQRAAYRASFLERAAPLRSAVERDRHAATAEPYLAEWWEAVYEMLDREFPGFFLPPKTRYPRDVFFAPKTSRMASYLRVDLKGHKGEVDLAFKNVSSGELAEALSYLEDVPGRVIANGKSSAIRIENLDPFRIADGCSVVETKVRAGYQAAHDLLMFARKHEARLAHLVSQRPARRS